MASRGVQYQLDSVQYQPLTTCNTGENSTVPYVDSCNEISHHMIIIIIVTLLRCIGYWIHKSALCAHILHEFVVLLEAKPSAKPQMSAIYGA